jgi:hypothetical protein
MRSAGRAMLVAMYPTLEHSSPGCDSTLATTRHFDAPAASLIAEAGVVPPHMVGRPTDGTRQQIADARLHHRVVGQTDRVQETLGLQERVDLRRRSGVGPSPPA